MKRGVGWKNLSYPLCLILCKYKSAVQSVEYLVPTYLCFEVLLGNNYFPVLD